MTLTSKSYDAIVVGLGAMGSSTLYHLALSGKRVLGIDQFQPPHAFGSSHGDTRITRQAIGEGEEYVPFALRSHELWRDIEQKTNTKLLFPVGGLIIGDISSSVVLHNKIGFLASTISAAEKFGIPHKLYEANDVRKKFPQFAISDNDIGYYEFGAGLVRPEYCIQAQLTLAKQHGAEIIVNQKVDLITQGSDGGGVEVETDERTYQAEQVVVTAGPWVGNFLEDESNYFKIYRQVLFWFSPKASIEPFLPSTCPVFIWSFHQTGGDGMYGFPAVDGLTGGVKIASEQHDVEEIPKSRQ